MKKEVEKKKFSLTPFSIILILLALLALITHFLPSADFDKNGEFLVSNYTQVDDMKLKEYLNLLDNKSKRAPRLLLRLLEAADYPNSWHDFDD